MTNLNLIKQVLPQWNQSAEPQQLLQNTTKGGEIEVATFGGGHVCRGLDEPRRGAVAGGEEGAGYGERVGHHLLPHPRVRRHRTLRGP